MLYLQNTKPQAANFNGFILSENLPEIGETSACKIGVVTSNNPANCNHNLKCIGNDNLKQK